MYKYKNGLAKSSKYVEGTKLPYANVLVQNGDSLTHQELTIDSRDLETLTVSMEQKVADYIDLLDNSYFYSDSIQEAKSEKSAGSSSHLKKLMLMTLNQASRDNVWLKDLNDFDYESYFENIIKHFQV